MGDYFVRIRPKNLYWTPSLEQDVAGAVELLKKKFALHEYVTVQERTENDFCCSPEILSSVQCNICGTELYMDNGIISDKKFFVWAEWMDKSYKDNFTNLHVVTECCGLPTSLDELHYQGNTAGFFRWHIEIDHPSSKEFPFGLLKEIEQKLNTSIKIIHHSF